MKVIDAGAPSILDAMTAIRSGEIRTNNEEATLALFDSLSVNPEIVTAFADEMQAQISEHGDVMIKDMVTLIFHRYIPMAIPQEKVFGMKKMVAHIVDVASFTLLEHQGQVLVFDGAADDAEVTFEVSATSFTAICRDACLQGASSVIEANRGAAMVQLDLNEMTAVRGGACSADASVGACGGNACGANTGVGLCGADACGANLGVGVCPAAACGLNLSAGPDIGACAINILPGVPCC